MWKEMRIVLAAAVLGMVACGCGESEGSKRNLAIITEEVRAQKIEREKAESEKRRKIEEARKWHRIQMEAYEKSMTPEAK